MAIDKTAIDIVSTTNSLTDLKESRAKKLSQLQTNIGKGIGTNFFIRTFNTIFRHRRTIALKQLKENLGNCAAPKQDWANAYLPQATQKLFREYLELFPEKFLSEEELRQIWTNGKGPPIGEGGFGTVFQSKDGKYVLKQVPSSVFSDRSQNLALINNAKDFAPRETYYSQNNGFITEYVGSITIENGMVVDVFEKIDGEDFDKCNAETPAEQCRLLAQAATAIAISHEAGCINHDVKPENMMVAKDSEGHLQGLKLIDQGALIDLEGYLPSRRGDISETPSYSAPEAWDQFTPAFDVFSLGITILQKLIDVVNGKDQSSAKTPILSPTPEEAEKHIEEITTRENFWKKIKIAFMYEKNKKLLEMDLNTLNNPSKLDEELKKIKGLFGEQLEGVEQFYRKPISERIAEECENFGLGTPEESKFIGLLLKDCLAIKPENRPSAAQVAEILHVFSSYLGNPTAECPDYETVKGMAIKDCPKGIPIAIRKMLFHSDPKIQQKAISIIEKLVEADPSYKSTPSFGMVLLLKEPSKMFSSEAFVAWAETCPWALKQLKERVYVFGDPHEPNQDMPINKGLYDKFQAFDITPYLNSLEYGMYLFQNEESFATKETWAKGNPQKLEELKKRTYDKSKEPQTDQNIPVPRVCLLKIDKQ